MKILHRNLSRATVVVLALAAGVAAGQADYPSTVLGDSPLAYWQFSETGVVANNNYIATNLGSAATACDGVYTMGSYNGGTANIFTMENQPGVMATDRSVLFNGFNQYILIPANSTAASIAPPFTVEAWINPANVTSTLCCPLASIWRTTVQAEGWVIYVSSVGWNLRTGAGASGYGVNITGGTPVVGAWSHLMATYDGSNAVLYLNGAVVATGSNTAYAPNTAWAMGLGARGDATGGGSGFPFPGYLDEVAVYPTNLPPSVASAHYRAATTNAAGYAAQILTSHPVGYWRLNDITLPVAANSGTLGAAANGGYASGATTGQDLTSPPGFANNNTVLQLNGSDFVTFPILNLNTNTVTMEAWVNFNGSPNDYTGLIMWRDVMVADGNGYGMGGGMNLTSGINGQGQLGYTWSASMDCCWGSGVLIQPGQWTYVALVISPSQSQVFVGTADGGWSSAANQSPNIGADGYNQSDGFRSSGVIGVDPCCGGRLVNGEMAQVAIYNQALTEGQLHTHALAAFGSASPPAMVTDPPALTPTGTIYVTTPFSLVADAFAQPPLFYQWRTNGTDIPGATARVYLNPGAALTDSGNYDVIVSNAYGAVTSMQTYVSIAYAVSPSITQPPQSQIIYAGGTAIFSAVATGGPLNYQWTFNSATLPGATDATLIIPSVSTAGNYAVTVANSAGNASASASLTVLPAPAPGTYEAALLAASPLAYWPLNEGGGQTAYDNFGGNNGAYTGGFSLGTPGPLTNDAATAVTFDGQSGCVQIPPSGTLIGSGLTDVTEATLLCWIYSPGDQGGLKGLLAMRPPSTELALGNNGDNNMLTYDWNSWWGPPQNGLTTPYGQWTLVALVIQLYQTTYYLGSADTGLLSSTWDPCDYWEDNTPTEFTASSPADPTGPWFIADDPCCGNRFFNGAIGQVALFTNALTSNQIAALFNLGLYGTATPAPYIFIQPQPQVVYAGGTASFSVGAGGAMPLGYQWTRNGTNLPGATNPTLLIPNLGPANAGSYAVIVNNALNVSGVTSAPASLTVLTAAPGSYEAALLSASPIGYWPLDETNGTTAFDHFGGYDGTYWNGFTLGAPGPLLGDPATAATFDGSTGYVQIPQSGVMTGSALSSVNEATFICWVNDNQSGGPADVGLLITRLESAPFNDTGLYIDENNNVIYKWNGSFWGDESGLVVPAGQWTFVAVTVQPGQTAYYLGSPGTGFVSYSNGDGNGGGSANFTMGPWIIANDSCCGDRFYNGSIGQVALFTNALTSGQLNVMYLAGMGILTAPVIDIPPVTQSVVVGASVTFSVQAHGSIPLSYQWQKDGSSISAATASSYTIPSVYYTDAGTYAVVVSNSVNSISSAPAQLTVGPPPTFANATNGLLLHLTFNSNYLDSSGLGNNAQAYGNPTFVQGKLGQAVYLSTQPTSNMFNYVQVPDPNGDFLFGATNSFSVSFWLNFTDLFHDLPVIGNAYSSTYDPGWQITDDRNNQLEWTFEDANNVAASADPAGGPYINDGLWHNIVVVFNRTSEMASTFVDGVKVNYTSIAPVGGVDSGTGLLTMGSDPTGTYTPMCYWDGELPSGEIATYTTSFNLDDLGLWGRPLTDYEVVSIYKAGQINQSFDVYGPVKVSASRVGANIDVSWQAGTLQQSGNVSGPYSTVTNAAAPFYRTTPGGSAMFFRVKL